MVKILKSGDSASSARRILLYGEPGIGKTTLAAAFPNPVILNFEDGCRDVACDQTEVITDLRSFIDLVTVELPKSDYLTVVIDPVNWLEKLMMQDVANRAGKATIEDIGFGKGYQSLDKLWSEVLGSLWFLWRQGRNIVMTCHETLDRFSDPEGDSYNFYRPALHRTGSTSVAQWCDEVWFAKFKRIARKADDGKRTIGAKDAERIIVTQNSPIAEAKNRLGMPMEISMNIESIKQFLSKPTLVK